MTGDSAHGHCNYLPATDGDCLDFRFQARSCVRLLNHFDLFALAGLRLHFYGKFYLLTVGLQKDCSFVGPHRELRDER